MRHRFIFWTLSAAFVIALVACGDGKARISPATDLAGAPAGVTIVRAGTLTGYYFEASVRTAVQARNSDHLVIKGWFEAPERTRWELMSSIDDSYRRVLLIDGDEQWFYEPGTNTYTYGREPLPLKGKPYPLNSYYQLGLVELPGSAPIRTDTYLGRTVDIYVTSAGQVTTEHWIDQEYGITLRQVVDSRSPSLASFEARVEKIVVNPRFDSNAFVFTPPPGAKEAGASGAALPRGTVTPSRGPLNIPQGMLSPSYLPPGYRLDSSTQSASGGVIAYLERKLLNENGDQLILRQQYRPGGMPAELQVGSVVKVGNDNGFVLRGGGETVLLVYKNDIIITLLATNLTLDDLRAIVLSMDE